MAGITTSIDSTFDKYSKKVVFSFGKIPFLTFDCSLSETHKREATPTEFVIENGQTITDHIVIKPFSLKIQGLISDTPLSGTLALINTGLSVLGFTSRSAPNPAVLKAKAGALAALPLIPQLSHPAKNAFSQLLVTQGLKLPFTVTTSLLTYNNMWIKSLSVPRETKNGSSIIVDLELVQLLLVKSAVSDTGAPQNADVAAVKKSEGDRSPFNEALNEIKKSYNEGLTSVGE